VRAQARKRALPVALGWLCVDSGTVRRSASDKRSYALLISTRYIFESRLPRFSTACGPPGSQNTIPALFSSMNGSLPAA
jgi:hypothetical protein